MSENNVVTKEALKEILAEMRQESRQEMQEFRAETFARIDESEKKTAARLEESERKTAARFEESERKTAARFDATDEKMEKMHRELLKMLQVHGEMLRAQANMIMAQNQKIDDQYEYFNRHHSRLLTSMDSEVKELDNIRVEQTSLGAIQNRHTRDMEAIKNRLGIADNNGTGGKNGSNPEPAKPSLPRKKKSK